MSKVKGSGGRRKTMVAGAAVLVLCGGAGAWFAGIGRHGGSAKHLAAATEQPVLVDLPDMISNLDTAGRRASFIKVHVKLQLSHEADAALVKADEAQLVDMIQTYLREMRPDEIRGGEGTYRLREALMNHVDTLLAPVEVSNLLFTQMLVQ